MAMETPKISNSIPATGATPKPATPVASNAAKVTSKTSALDAASGTTSMEAELRAEESGPPKIDNKKLTGIGSATSGADDQLVAEAKKESARKVEDAGKSPAGDALSTAGGLVGAGGGGL